MLPPALLPEILSKGSLPRLAHSALPDAPVQPHREPRSRRVVAGARTIGRSIAATRGTAAHRIDDEPVPVHA